MKQFLVALGVGRNAISWGHFYLATIISCRPGIRLAGSRLKTWWEIHGNVQVATDEDVALNLRYPEPRRLAKAQIVERQIDTLNARIKALQEQKSAKEDKLQGLYSEAFHAGQPLTLAEVAEMGRAQMAEVLKVERSKARNKALHRRIEVEE